MLAGRRRYYPSVDSLAPLTVLGREVVELAVKPAFLPDTNGGALSPEQARRMWAELNDFTTRAELGDEKVAGLAS